MSEPVRRTKHFQSACMRVVSDINIAPPFKARAKVLQPPQLEPLTEKRPARI